MTQKDNMRVTSQQQGSGPASVISEITRSRLLSVLLSLAVLVLIVIIVIAFVQGRSISFWPPSIGGLPTAIPQATPLTSTPAATTTASIPTAMTIPTSISIFTKCYHLGDDTRSDLCPNAPQADPFEGRFQIRELGGSAFIRMTVKDVDPSEIQSPIRVYINGYFVDYLNRYVKEETLEYKDIEMPLLSSFLHVGENSILIFSSPGVNAPQKGVDDFELSNLGIVFR